MAGRPKGLPKTGGGSRKGVPNKATRELKEMILGALDDAGGQKYLTAQAKLNPSAFMQLIGKVLPMQMQHSGSISTAKPEDMSDEQIADRIAKLQALRSAGA